MRLIDAISMALTEHVIYFLTTAYVESLDYIDPIRGLPQQARHLPLRSVADIEGRLSVLRFTLATGHGCRREDRPVIEEAVAIFGAALERLRALGVRAHMSCQREPHEQGFVAERRAASRAARSRAGDRGGARQRHARPVIST